MAKLAPRDLAQVLSKLPQQNSENIIVGFENSDDAGVFRLNDEVAIVQTVDFFTPVADDPAIYGQIAAVNALNDVYAMGATPISALSIVCFPQNEDWEILRQILEGGQKALNRENVVVLGGHSIDDKEMKFGYAVTGIVHPKEVITNAGAKEDDWLILTKPIGTGVISTGVKFQKASRKAINASIKTMTISAAAASKEMRKLKANGCTDVTGFGLLGHAFEMAKASGVTFEIVSENVPLLPDILKLIDEKMLTRGDKNNREYVGETVNFGEKVSKQMQSALFDPQTAGGLLISLEPEKAEKFLKKIKDSVVIGKVEKRKDYLMNVI